jgi:hypothetical protein
MILQNLWESRLDWDEPIPEDISNDWKSYIEELSNLESICIPSNVKPNDPKKLILHDFSDASYKAICAVFYVVGISDMEITSQLLTSKSNVTPFRMVTMPRH